MADNKTITQEDPIVSITGSELFRIAILGKNFKVSFNQLLAWITSSSNNVSTITIPNGTTEREVGLGSTGVYDGFMINYVATRGDRVKKGIIQIAHDGTNAGISESGTFTLPNTELEDCGLTFGASIVYGVCDLLITTDSSDTTDTIFKYSLSKL